MALELSLDGLLSALDLTGVADGTELHGFQGWTVFRSAGSGAGFYEIRSEEIHTIGTLTYGLAIWNNDAVANPGHVVRAEIASPDWNTILPGLVANGEVDHDSDTRGLWWNSWELALRSGAGDYGEGFVADSGVTPSAPLITDHFYEILLAAVQDDTLTNPRGGMVFANVELTWGESSSGIGGGLNTLVNSYPGLIYWSTANAKWRNYKVYRDYRVKVRGLSGTQAVQLLDPSDVVLASSGVQVGGTATLDLHLLSWPITGYIQTYTDTTYTTEVASGRYPEVGNSSIIRGGNIYDLASASLAGVYVNWDDAADPPDEWGGATKNVTLDVEDVDVVQEAANPNITVDTAIFTLRDPTGKYVIGRTESPLYPNVRTQKWIRWVTSDGGVTKCRWIGKIRSITPVTHTPDSGDREQRAVIRGESILREISKLQLTLITYPTGALVNPDGMTGVIPELLKLIPDVVPAANWKLSPTSESVEQAFFDGAQNFLTALEQLAILSDSIYYIEPDIRTTVPQVNWWFVWKSRDAQLNEAAAHEWVDTDDDIHDFNPLTYSDDEES